MGSRPVYDHLVGSSRRPSKGERVMGALFPSRGVGWPGGWSQDRLEQVLHLKNWTYVAITTIAKKIGQLVPNTAYTHKRKIPGRTQKYCHSAIGAFGGSTHVDYGASYLSSGAYYKKTAGSNIIKPHEELEPLEEDHPLRKLIDCPNPFDTSFDLLYELDMFLELCGVAYLWVVPNDFGYPSELWVIPSHWVWPRTGGANYVRPDNPYADQLIQWYEIRPWGGMGSAGILRFPPDEIIMFNWKSPINKIDGYSTQAAIAQWIDTEESISKSRWSQFINQARPEFWVELGPEFEDPTEDQIDRVATKFMAKYTGEFNFGKPIFTPPGAKVTPLSFNPTEMSYFQSEEQIRDMILSGFGVPKSVVGISNDMTFGSLLAAAANFCTTAINPRLAMLGLRLTKFLAPKFDRGEPIKIWWDDCSPADPQQVNADIQADQSAMAITPNEVRALRGREPYKHGGDDPMGQGPGGMVPIPLNTGDDLTDLASLVPVLGQQEGEGGGPEQMLPGQGGDEEQPPALPDLGAPKIDEPNGKPQPEKVVEKSLQRWDKWFALSDAETQKAWSDAKIVYAGNLEALNNWARIIEYNRLTKAIESKDNKNERQYSSTQFNLDMAGYSRSQGSPLDTILDMQSRIADEHLAFPDGKEDCIHVTVKYGLHTGDPEEVRKVVQGFGPVELTLGKTSIFAADQGDSQRGGAQFDVVKIDVEGQKLRYLNHLLGQSLPCTDTFPIYHPHLTLAYVQPGLGEQYSGMNDVEGMQVICTHLVFEGKDKKAYSIDLIREQPPELVEKDLISLQDIGISQPTNAIQPPTDNLVPLSATTECTVGYGVLCDPVYRQELFGRNVEATPDILPNWVKVGDNIIPDRDGGTVPVVLFYLTIAELLHNDQAEQPYRRVRVTTATGKEAWAWLLDPDYRKEISKSGDSYFTNCERDDKGHCLPEGGSSVGGSTEQDSNTDSEEPEQTQNESDDEPSNEDKYTAWQQRDSDRANKREALRDFNYADNLPETDSLREAYEKMKNIWANIHTDNNGDVDLTGFEEAIQRTAEGHESLYNAVINGVQELGEGKKADKVKAVAEKAKEKIVTALHKWAEVAKEYELANAEIDKHHMEEPELEPADEDYPPEPEEPVYPDEPDYEEPDDEPLRENYEGEGADDHFQMDHDEWQKEVERIVKDNDEKEQAYNQAVEEYEQTQSQFEKDHEKWDEAVIALQEKQEKLHEKWEQKATKLEEKKDRLEEKRDDLESRYNELEEDWHGKVNDALDDFVNESLEKLEEEEENDPEPEEEPSETEKSLATVISKATCKPGQTAANTGCTPASGGTSSAPTTQAQQQSNSINTTQLTQNLQQTLQGTNPQTLKQKAYESIQKFTAQAKQLPRKTVEIAKDPKKQLKLTRTVASGAVCLARISTVAMATQSVKDVVAGIKTLAKLKIVGKGIKAAFGKGSWTADDTKQLKRALYDVPAFAITETANFVLPVGPYFALLYKVPALKPWFPEELTKDPDDPISKIMDKIDQFTAIPEKWLAGSKAQQDLTEDQINFFLTMVEIMEEAFQSEAAQKQSTSSTKRIPNRLPRQQ